TEETEHDDHIPPPLIAKGNGALAAVEHSRNSFGIRVERHSKTRHLDRRAGICRIVRHSVMHRVQTLEQIAVAHPEHSQDRSDQYNLYSCCHCCSSFSLKVVLL